MLERGNPGDWIGVPEALLSCPYLYDAVTEVQSDTLVFSISGFREIVKLESLRRFFLEYLAKSVYTLHAQIALNAPYLRLVYFLMTHSVAETSAGSIVRATQDEIAQSISTTRETVNKYLQELQRKGLVQTARGCIRIPETSALGEEIV